MVCMEMLIYIFVIKKRKTSWRFQINVIPLHSQISKTSTRWSGNGGIAQLVRASDS